MYLLGNDRSIRSTVRNGFGDASLCMPHTATKGELCTFVSKKGGSTTAVYIPEAGRGMNPLNLLVWFHGDLVCGSEGKSTLSYVLSSTFPMAKQLAESRQPLALVAPTMNWTLGNNKKSHPLGSPRRLNQFLEEVRSLFINGSSAPPVGRLILAGHSRAYVVLNALAAAVHDPESSRGALAALADIWLFDTTYGKLNKMSHCTNWIRWAKAKTGVNLHILYRRDSDTAAVAECIRDETQKSRLNNITVEGISSHCSLPRDQMPNMLARSRRRAGVTNS